MDNEELQDIIEAKPVADPQLEKMRSPVTILFSDIQGSTSYFEKRGDVAGMAMVQRHHDLLFPSIEGQGGRVVKTIGDAIMARFDNPVDAVKAAVAMQRALDRDRKTCTPEEQIHIRVGVHTGLGLVKDNDVYGDVVNAASRVEHQAQPDQILITDVLRDAACAAGFQCVNFGKADMHGKEEPIDVYALAWSDEAAGELLAAVQARYEAKLKETKRLADQLEEELDRHREQWRNERRKLSTQVEELEQQLEKIRENARSEVSTELQAMMRFQLDGALRARNDAQQQFDAAQARWQEERGKLRQQMASMQGSLIDAMERSNNPARIANLVRDQVETRLAEARQEWQFQWEAERRQLLAEIERLRKSNGVADDRKEAAKRAVLEKLGKLPAGSSAQQAKTPDQWQKEFDNSRIQWETERDQLRAKVERLEREIKQATEVMRAEVHQEMRERYDAKVAEAVRGRQNAEDELRSTTEQLKDENKALKNSVEELEKSIPAAQEAAQRQVRAELAAEYEARMQEDTRLRTRAERKLQDALDELEGERRRAQRQIAKLEEQLKEARGAAFRAQRSTGPASSEGA
jgi:class 3 adenylate cyclase